MATMIHYKIGSRSTGKSYAVKQQTFGKNNLYIEPTKSLAKARKRFLDMNYSETVNDIVVDVKESLEMSMVGINNIVIDDLNQFLSNLFPHKEIYVNINNLEQNVIVETSDTSFITNNFREYMQENLKGTRYE